MRSSAEMRFALRMTAVALLLLLAAGCGHLPSWHWPGHRSSAAAEPVRELDISGSGAAESFPQSWKRNTLVVDLSSAAGAGSITLKPAEGGSWPVRLALRVMPGTIGLLEVRGAQRLSLPISGTAGKPVDLELTPGVYTPLTPELTVAWGPGNPSPGT